MRAYSLGELTHKLRSIINDIRQLMAKVLHIEDHLWSIPNNTSSMPLTVTDAQLYYIIGSAGDVNLPLTTKSGIRYSFRNKSTGVVRLVPNTSDPDNLNTIEGKTEFVLFPEEGVRLIDMYELTWYLETL
jgi:predicted component of type VI protein secretion system